MAYTYTDFKNGIKSLFGYGQTNVSGDGGGDVKDHNARLHSKIVVTQFPLNATATNLIDMSPIFIAEEECDVRSIRCAIEAALTLSATDYVKFIVLKKKSPTWSVTESVATLNFGQTSAWSTNIAGMSKAFTLATTASVIDMDPGDTLCMKITLNGANAIGRPATAITVVAEEK